MHHWRNFRGESRSSSGGGRLHRLRCFQCCNRCFHAPTNGLTSSAKPSAIPYDATPELALKIISRQRQSFSKAWPLRCKTDGYIGFTNPNYTLLGTSDLELQPSSIISTGVQCSLKYWTYTRSAIFEYIPPLNNSGFIVRGQASI